MERNRRNSERVWTNFAVRWQGPLASGDATVSDISVSGCFILTGGEVSPGELVSLEIDIPQALRLRLWGKVVYRIADIGFALRFKGLTITELTLLRRLMEYVRIEESKNLLQSTEPESLEQA
jgi:hypothetical protein